MRDVVSFMKHAYPYTIGAAVLAFVLTRVNVAMVTESLAGANMLYLLAALILTLPLLILEAARWKYLTDRLTLHMDFWECFRIFNSALFIGLVTPARLGEFLRYTYLKEKGYSTTKALFSVFLDRFFDILFLLIAAYIGFSLFFSRLAGDAVAYALVALIAGFALFLAFLRTRLATRLVTMAYGYFAAKIFRKEARHDQGSIASMLSIINFQNIAVVAVMTAASWALYFFQSYLLAKSIGIGLGFTEIAALISFSGILNLLPLSVAGIGTRDALYVVAFSLLGLRPETAIAFSVLVLSMIVANALFSLPFWLSRPAKIRI